MSLPDSGSPSAQGVPIGSRPQLGSPPIPNSSVPHCRCLQPGCACNAYALRLEQRWKANMQDLLDCDLHLEAAERYLSGRHWGSTPDPGTEQADSGVRGRSAPLSESQLSLALGAVQAARTQIGGV